MISFSFGLMVKSVWKHFYKNLNNFDPDLKFICDSNEKEIPFLDLKVKLNEGETSTDLYIRYTGRH